MRKAIIHNGSAHRDEFVALAIWMALKGVIANIFRRDPTQEELNDPEVLVIDVGGQHNPALNNFDHHQERGLPAAFRLVAKHLGFDSLAVQVYKWWSFASEMDTNLFGAFKSIGVTPDAGFTMLDPIGGFLVRQLEQFSGETPLNQEMVNLIYNFGCDLVGYIQKVEERLNLLRSSASVLTVNGLNIVTHEIKNNPSLGMDIFRSEQTESLLFNISITPDDRGDGWALYRYNDNPRVNFSVLENNPNITFAHKGGFIAKTVKMSLQEAIDLAKLAITE